MGVNTGGNITIHIDGEGDTLIAKDTSELSAKFSGARAHHNNQSQEHNSRNRVDQDLASGGAMIGGAFLLGLTLGDDD